MESQIPAAAEAPPQPAQEESAPPDQRFQALVEGLDAIVWEMDVSTWLFTYVSPQAERLLGYPVERWYGDSTFWPEQLVHPDDRGWAVPFCTSATSEGRDHEFDYRALAADGRVVWLRDMVRVVTDAAGRPRLLRGVMVDISDEKRAEEALRERARHIALSADVSSALADGVTLREILQRCTEAMVEHLDAAFARIWTLNEAEQVLELQASAGLYTHLDGPHGRVPVGSFKIGLIAAERTPHLTNDVQHDPRVGDKEWARREGMVSFAGYPLLVGGRLVGVVAMFARHPLTESVLDALQAVSDRIALVVERKESESTLRERELQLAEAQRIAHLGSWEWDVRTDRVRWSDELYRIYGLEPQSVECTFGSYLERVHPGDRERVRATIEEAYRSAGTFDFEEHIVRPDGEVRLLHSRGRVLTGADGEPVRLVGICQDVTEQRAAAQREIELAREQAARQRAEEEEARTGFLSEAGQVLSSSLDYATTLQSFAHLAVPRVADWCAIDILQEDGRIQRVVTAHPDPEKEALAAELAERYPPDPRAATGVPQVLRTGRPELVPEIPEEIYARPDADPEYLRVVRELGLRSYMVVPLIARGRTLGAITFVSAESGERYDEADLRFAQELASRAALAVDNARLYQMAERAREQNTRILESITDAFFALDREWRFAYVNPEAERVLHRPAGELLGRNIWDAFPEAVGSTFERAYRKAVAKQQTVQFEEYFPPLDTWFEVRAYPGPDGLSVFFRNVNERHRAEEELRQSEERFRSLVEAAATIVWTTPASGEFETPQPEWSRFTGQGWEELRGWGWLDAVHPDDRAQTAAAWKRAMRDWAIFEVEHRLRRHDGEFRHMQVRAVPIVGRDGEIREWVGVHTDVTEQRRAEEAVRESEERFRYMANAVPVHIWTARPDGRLDYVSDRAAEFFGSTPRELIGAGWLSVVHPEDQAGMVERWTRSVRTGEPYEMQFRLRTSQGDYRWHLGRASAQRDAAGAVLRWYGSNTDIHDQKEAEAERERLIAALETERRRLENVFADAPAAIAITRGPQHEFVSANPVYRQMTGREVVGRSIREAFPELEGLGFFELMDQVYATGEPYVGNETHVRFDRDGDGALEEGYFNFVYQPLFNSLGEPTGVMTFAVEVSDQVWARHEVEQKAEELARLARALEVSNRELDQFAYVASHDLKAPLRGIANLSQWIEEDLEGEVSPEVREHLELLRGRVHRMEGLIDGILQYSRAGRVRERPERVEVGALLAEVVDLLSPPQGFQVRIGGGMPTLVTERLPLQQVFMNLIGNAVKYAAAEGGRAEVRVQDAGAFHRFTVSDNGPGIAPEYHERIFGIFQTLEARDKVEGTGIGLSLVKKIVENRGGRVWIESEEGAGASFHFTWPKEASEP